MPTDAPPQPQATVSIMRAFRPEWWAAKRYFERNPRATKLPRHSGKWIHLLTEYYERHYPSKDAAKKAAEEYLYSQQKREALLEERCRVLPGFIGFQQAFLRFTHSARSKTRPAPMDTLSQWRPSEAMVHSFECVRFPEEGRLRVFMCLVHRPLDAGGQATIKFCFDSRGNPWIRKVQSKITLQNEESVFRMAPVRAAKLSAAPYAARASVRRAFDSLNRPYYINKKITLMPFFDSGTMKHWRDSLSGELSGAERTTAIRITLTFFKSLFEQVSTLHEHHLVHLDLKPQNVFLHGFGQNIQYATFAEAENVRVYLGDFDLARSLSYMGHTSLCSVGTEGYRAPEMSRGRGVMSSATTATDAYSLGLMLHEFASILKSGEMESLSRSLCSHSPCRRTTLREAIHSLDTQLTRLASPGQSFIPYAMMSRRMPTESLKTEEFPQEQLLVTCKDRDLWESRQFSLLGMEKNS